MLRIPRNIHKTSRIAYRQLSMKTDITGNVINSTNTAAIFALDESIMDMLSSNKDARVRLTEAVNLDNSLYFARILKVFECYRYQLDYSTCTNVAQTLQNFDKLLEEGKLSSREGWYAAAALAWYEGNYVQAGKLLESSLIENPRDLLAVRLAQDAYITSGSSQNALGCLVRHPCMVESPAHLHGYLIGILANGYTETGRMKLAEEEGERGVISTRGQNCWGLYGLVNTFQLDCRSSEIYSKLDEFISKHEDTTALAYLYYNKGSAHIMRGNYSGAFKIFEELFEILQQSEEPNSVAWTNSVLLLWQLSLNTKDFSIGYLDPMWKLLSMHVSEEGGVSTPLQKICVSIVYSHAMVASKSSNNKTNITNTTADSADTTGSSSRTTDISATTTETPSTTTSTAQSWWKNVTGMLPFPKNPNSGNDANSSTDPLDAQYKALRKIGTHIRKNYSELLQKLDTLDYEVLYKNHVNKLQNIIQQKERNTNKYLNLKEIQSNITIIRSPKQLYTTTPTTSSSTNMIDSNATDLEFSIEHSVLPISTAINSFCLENFKESSDIILNLKEKIYLLGGTAAQRAVFDQLAVEA